MFRYTRFFLAPALLVALALTTGFQAGHFENEAPENEPPVVEIDLLGCNGSFFFDGVPIQYKVRVSDKEDGSLEDGEIAPGDITFSIEYSRDGEHSEAHSGTTSFPLEGTYLPPQDSSKGVVIIKASYTDKGVNGKPGISSEATLMLRSAMVNLSTGHLSEGATTTTVSQMPGELTLAQKSGAYVLFANTDLTGLSEVRFLAMAPKELQSRGGVIEVRVDSPDGPLIGETPFIDSVAPTEFAVPLEASTGVYDLYIVFQKDGHSDEPGDGNLFAVMTAQFVGSS